MLTIAAGTPSPSPSASSVEAAVQSLGKVVVWPILVVVVLVVAFFLRWLIFRIIDRTVMHLADNALARRLATTGSAMADKDEEDVAERLRLRARTVGGILKSITSLVVLGIAVIVVLASIGVDIGPIILSAGVVGIAVGFGAQSLVKDFLTGVFMILEDQFAVGDYVDTGQATGTVEEVGLRLSRIRDDQGVIWYVPHGSVERIGNRSQGLGLAVVDIPLAYGADVEAAGDALRAAVADLMADPQWSSDLIDEPPMVIVESMTATAVNMQVRVRTRALRHWAVGRALRERVLTSLDAAGIERPAVAGSRGIPLLDPQSTDPTAELS